MHLGFGMEEDYLSMYDVLTDQTSLDEVRHPVDSNLWLSPSHIDLAAAEMELAGAVGREIILRDKMADVAEEFDFIIFDCPPSLGILTLNALTTAEEVFLPLQPHFLALHGLSKLLRTIDLVARRLNPVLRLSNVVYCLYDSGTRLANEVVHDVEVFFEEQRDSNTIWADAFSFDTRIRRNIRLAEAPVTDNPFFNTLATPTEPRTIAAWPWKSSSRPPPCKVPAKSRRANHRSRSSFQPNSGLIHDPRNS